MVYLKRQGKLTRYNLRKFTELPFQVKKNQIHKNLSYCCNTKQKQLVRCFRYKDLYDNVLFNYQVFFIILR